MGDPRKGGGVFEHIITALSGEPALLIPSYEQYDRLIRGIRTIPSYEQYDRLIGGSRLVHSRL